MGESVSKQVLRYWLACVRMEEALGTRPRARRTPARPGPVRIEMAQPVEGAEYLRLPCDDAMWKLPSEQGAVRVPVDAAAGAFFETWLNRQYRGGPGAPTRRTTAGGKASKDAEDRVKHLLCFPVVHLPRQELAGLLRCDVQVDFLQPDGGVFAPPGAKLRRAREFPPAPTEVRINGAQDAPEGRLPFFVDTRLLNEQLGVEPQEIDGFFQSLGSSDAAQDPVTPLAMLTALCDLLAPAQKTVVEVEHDAAQRSDAEADVTAVLQLLVQRMNARLSERPNRGKAYAIAIVMDAQQARSTWHLQRELQLLIEEKPPTQDSSTAERPALDAYLTGQRPQTGLALQRAAYPGSPLTPSQRSAAESFLGSPLSAVQGPPGTGKTTVILHLAAEHIVQQVDSLVDDGKMGYRLMVVASTNNRAVDNVIEPLNLDPALGVSTLPLSLRTGSREVCEKVTTRQIRDAVAWLARHTHRSEQQGAQAGEALGQAIEAYRAVRTRLLEGEAGRAEDMQRRAHRMQIEAELAQLDRRLAPGPMDAELQAQGFTRADLNLVKRTPDALDKVAQLASADASPKAMKRLDRAYAKFQRDLGADVQALHARTPAAASDPWPLPPKPKTLSPEEVMEAWEDAIEQCAGIVEVLTANIAADLKTRDLLAERERLGAALADAIAATGDIPWDAFDASASALDPLRVELFEAALSVREAWAIVHAVDLHDALQIAAKCVASERSMRTLFRAEDEAGRWLRRLCGVWGCTLLSMANAVPTESKALQRVVIDEAGQCHPAHAVSALMRCQSALIIGDVNQLEPVIGLGLQDEGRVQAQAQIQLDEDTLGPYRVFSEGRNSVQSLADRALGGPLQLIDHFRCQRPIIALCDALCDYGLRVHTRPSSRTDQAPFLHAPLLFKEVDGEQERLGGSWVNHAELEACMQLLESMLRAGIGSEEVAIITPYRGQLELLERAAAQRGIQIARGLKTEDQLHLFGGAGTERGLTLGTVHRFQGGERSVVIFSSVVTRSSSLGFLNNRVNLLNVTVSRAREHLVTLGQAETLASGRYTRRLVTGADVAELG